MSTVEVFHKVTAIQKQRRSGFLAAVFIGSVLMAVTPFVNAGLPVSVDGRCLLDASGVNGCTAGDIGVNDIEITVVSDGCINSTTDTATVNIELALNAAQPTRYDVGLFLATDGGDAITSGGTCFREALFPLQTTQSTQPDAAERDSGIGPFLDEQGPPNTCGEVSNGFSYQRLLVDGDVASGSTTAAELVIACRDTIDGSGVATPNGYLDLGWVVSWRQNAGFSCTSVADAVPGTGSKCQSGRTDSSNSLGIPIGVPSASLGISINCTPDQIGPGDYVDCTMTYTNPGIGAADNIEYRIDFPENLGSVSQISSDAAYSTSTGSGAVGSDGTLTTDYIQVVPGGGSTPGIANVPGDTTQSMTFRFTVSDTATDPDFTISAYTWFNNGTFTSYQGLYASDTTTLTPAFVSEFTTHRHRGQTLVQWETAAETGTAGFYLERKNPAIGTWDRVNEGLLPAILERPGGGTYAFLDTQAKPMNTQTYRLVAVDITGKQEIHGPFERSASRSSGLDNFDAVQSNGFARVSRRPSTAQVAAWDSKRDARSKELREANASKGIAPAGSAPVKVRINTSGEGLYSLSVSTLATLFGMTEREIQKAIRKDSLLMTHGDSPISYLPSDDFDRLFFFGQEIDSRFTEENTYWATLNNRGSIGSNPVMHEIDGHQPAAVNLPQTFVSDTTVEEDIWLVPYAVSDPEADLWFGGFISTGYYGDTTYVTTVQTPDVSRDGTAEIRLELIGLTNLATGDDHHAEVRLNGALIAEARWDGATPYSLVATFNQSILHDGSNDLSVNGVLHGDVQQSSFVVDTINLAFNRYYRAIEDSLVFGSDGNRVVTVEGFTGPDIEVFDIQDRSRPLHVVSTQIDRSASGYRVTFAPSFTDGQYLAVLRSAVLAPTTIEIDKPSTLRSRENTAEYVVIAPTSLHRGAQYLVDYRQQRFSGVRLIDLQDIYDEFNAGVEDPTAIRSFIRYALTSWKGAPRYVVLAGKGTLDPMDIQGYGTNVLPLVMSPTPYGVFASDSRLADVVGSDGVPDVAIGRIPALSSNDLSIYVDKLRNYESSGNQNGQNVLMLADDEDNAGRFPTDSLNVALHLPANVTPIHVAHQAGTDGSGTRQQVLDALDQGVMLFNYIGHGAPTQLGNEAFWALSDIAAMNNSDRLPVFAAFTCYAGNGTYPGLNSLTEEMTLSGHGGVIAALAPTGLSINNRAIVLNQAFVDALFSGDQTIGEAAQTAIEQLRQQGGPQFMQEIYNVIGDPAIEINR